MPIKIQCLIRILSLTFLVVNPSFTQAKNASPPRVQTQVQKFQAKKRILQTPAQKAAKYKKLSKFVHTGLLPVLRNVRQTLNNPQYDKATAIALIIETMHQTGMRIGSQQYATREKAPSYGASSLRKEHVTFEKYKDTDGKQKTRVRLRFVGKSRKVWDVTITDPKLVNAYKLFAQKAENGPLFPSVNEKDVLDILKPQGGWNHAFRYMRSNMLLRRELRQMPKPETKAQAEKQLKSAIKAVAKELFHSSPATTREHYLNPATLEGYAAGLK